MKISGTTEELLQRLFNEVDELRADYRITAARSRVSENAFIVLTLVLRNLDPRIHADVIGFLQRFADDAKETSLNYVEKNPDLSPSAAAEMAEIYADLSKHYASIIASLRDPERGFTPVVIQGGKSDDIE